MITHDDIRAADHTTAIRYARDLLICVQATADQRDKALEEVDRKQCQIDALLDELHKDT